MMAKTIKNPLMKGYSCDRNMQCDAICCTIENYVTKTHQYFQYPLRINFIIH